VSESAATRPETIWSARHAWVTAGSVALIFLAALQSLAVTTVMPVVSADLGGAALYAVAFSGTLATSVIGMVVVGAWSDRTGPVAPLTAAVALFVVGLVIAGLAPTMPVLVAGRLVQGLGTGGQVVALYVVTARVYPPSLHGRVFAAFSAAWVVPSLIGPFLAGAVAEFLHWRWVFLGVAVLTAAAFAMVALRLRGIPLRTDHPATGPIGIRMLCAVLVERVLTSYALIGSWQQQFVGVLVMLVVALVVLGVRLRLFSPVPREAHSA